MAAQKFTNFDKLFLMHANMTAVTIQSNIIVSNEVKDNKALLEPSYESTPNELFGQSNIRVHI